MGAAAYAASSAGRKRKQAAAAADDYPAASPRQRHRGRRPTEARDDAVTAGAESTQDGGGHADESSSDSDDGPCGLWKEGMFLPWWMKNRDRLMKEHGIVDRSDEELQKTLGLDKVMKLLNRDYGDSLLFRPWTPEKH